MEVNQPVEWLLPLFPPRNGRLFHTMFSGEEVA